MMLIARYMGIKFETSVAVVFDLKDTLYNKTEFPKSTFPGISVSMDKRDWRLL